MLKLTVNPHEPLEHVASALAGVEQLVPHAPHCVMSLLMLTSQPLDALPSQSLNPALHCVYSVHV
jgi:hypothetical protein